MVKNPPKHRHRHTWAPEGPGALPSLRLRDLQGRDVIVIAEALLLLPAVQLAVRLAGLQRTAAWAARLVGRRVTAALPASNATEIERIAQLIRGICRRWPFRASCLDRSLVTLALLGQRRVPATICIGFRKGEADVEGHAWVEHNARPLAETADVTAMSRQVFAWQDRKPSVSAG